MSARDCDTVGPAKLYTVDSLCSVLDLASHTCTQRVEAALEGMVVKTEDNMSYKKKGSFQFEWLLEKAN